MGGGKQKQENVRGPGGPHMGPGVSLAGAVVSALAERACAQLALRRLACGTRLGVGGERGKCSLRALVARAAQGLLGGSQGLKKKGNNRVIYGYYGIAARGRKWATQH